MKNFADSLFCKAVLLALLNFVSGHSYSQESKSSDFWSHVQFGGGLGLSIGNRYTDITVAPAAIYNFNEYVGLGVGLQGSYVKVKEEYQSYMYGGSLIGLFNPIEQIQLSAELEQLRVNAELLVPGFEDVEDNFWNTALFLGAGFRSNNFTVGFRYNVLHDDDRQVYYQPFMPFVRVFF